MQIYIIHYYVFRLVVCGYKNNFHFYQICTFEGKNPILSIIYTACQEKLFL